MLKSKIDCANSSKTKLDNLANAPHQGVQDLLHHMNMPDFDQFIQSQKDKEGLSTVVILDGLEDPHNLGSILRTADSSVDGVIIPKRRSVALTQTVAKASTGAIQHVPVMRVTNLAKQLTN